MKIITLTLNPAFDTHCNIESLVLHHENFAKITSTDAGGKGVNISRALTANGVPNRAVVITGTQNQALFLQMLESEGLDISSIEAKGRIRENITVHETGKDETRISFEGFSCDKSILDKVLEAIGNVDSDTVVTFTGSAPVGLLTEDISKLLQKLRDDGAKIVIDSRSFTPSDLVRFKPWLIKPNKDEAEAFANSPVTDVSSALKVAVDFYNKGIENVLISLGADGAVLACKDGVFHADAPKINAISTIGAGDSMIAGFISGFAKGLDIQKTLSQAIAFGSAACLQEGTRAPERTDIEEIIKNVKVSKVCD